MRVAWSKTSALLFPSALCTRWWRAQVIGIPAETHEACRRAARAPNERKESEAAVCCYRASTDGGGSERRKKKLVALGFHSLAEDVAFRGTTSAQKPIWKLLSFKGQNNVQYNINLYYIIYIAEQRIKNSVYLAHCSPSAMKTPPTCSINEEDALHIHKY